MSVDVQTIHAENQRLRFEDEENMNLFKREISEVPEILLKELNGQRNNPSLCDVSITTKDGRKFHAHKKVLSSCSRYLQRRLSSLDTENATKEETVINLGMVSSKGCETLLELLYTSNFSLTNENAAEVLLAAEVLDLQSVSALCRQYLRSGIISKLVTKSIDSSSMILPDINSEKTRSSESFSHGLLQEIEQRTDNNNSDTEQISHANSNPNGVSCTVDRDNRIKLKPCSPSKRPASLSSIPGNSKPNNDAQRPLSTPCLLEKSFDRSEKVTFSYESPRESPPRFFKPDTNAINQTPDDNVFKAPHPESTLRFKVKSEVKFLPSSQMDYKSPTATVGYANSHFSTARNLQHPASHFSLPFQTRRNYTDAFPAWSQRTNDCTDGLHRHKAAQLEQCTMHTPTHIPETSMYAGLHPTASSLWASLCMMQSQAMNSAGKTIDDASSPHYPGFVRGDFQNSRPLLAAQRLVCRLCGLPCASEWDLLIHLQCRHFIDCMGPLLSESNVELQKDSYLDKKSLRRERITHAKTSQRVLSPKTTDNFKDGSTNALMSFMKPNVKNKTLHKCYHCKKDFDSILSLRKHKSLEHVKRPHQCHICEAAFPNKAGLSVHLRSHTGERPYQCKICNKAFTQLGHVQRHQKVHTGEKPYQCPLCQARVRDKASMHYHLLAHQGVKPFQCDQCDARFTKRSSLVKHQNVHTGSHLYQCPQCKASFREKASLSRHVRSQHKDSQFLINLGSRDHSQ